VPVKRPIVRYAMLAFLFAITMVYEVRYTGDILRGERVDVPFFITESATNRIAFATPDAHRAGIRTGDQLLAVDGVPYTGTSVLGDARARARPGSRIVLTVSRPAVCLRPEWHSPAADPCSYNGGYCGGHALERQRSCSSRRNRRTCF